ncbi:undecaprenyl-diphosphate phosphatase [Mechercharimyces sp. CAU 1602]|uniref:undecaprenyl-diphosphate phosphatase n=1 Tax=Mechercharimyces sp. CAU 1602 TaxID=2973933 RepID=UPI00216177D5|nr:undecaprenyl-diphosphate phosphatase [Mechercharimyces sp. CAU 1602]MCS1351904.1 undecaprenyl-diphosphate phosphatase [Mechercharimyces sp. CAU 1602]
MGWFEAMILGIIQGLTEFLPISSTGHLYLGRHMFGLDEAGLFLDTLLHFGTLLAVIIVFREELLVVVKNPLGRLARLLFIGTIPTALIGLTFNDFFTNISQTGETIGWEFLATGCILWIADRWKETGYKEMEQISVRDALIIGTFQGVAILPAISRSGLTIAAALLRQIEKKSAASFSFLLSIPAITGAVVLQSRELADASTQFSLPLSSLLLATVTAALCGYFAVKWMIRILCQGSLKGFAVYVWALGAIVLILQYSDNF